MVLKPLLQINLYKRSMYLQLINYVSQNLTNYYSPLSNERIQFYGPIKYINIYVGPNNAGKSRFLRSILNTPNLYISENESIFNIIKEINDLVNVVTIDKNIRVVRINFTNMKLDINKFEYPFTELIIQDIDGVYDININYFQQLIKEINKLFKDIAYLNDFQKFLKLQIALIKFLIIINDAKLNNGNHIYYEISQIKNLPNIAKYLKQILVLLEKLSENLELKIETPKKRIYIPTFRSSALLSQADTDILKDFIKSKYEFIKEDSLEIFTGQMLFSNLQKLQGSRRDTKNTKKLFEQFISTTFFNNESTEITLLDPNSENNHKNIAITIGDIERELHNLGDGINAILTLLYKLFTTDDNSWIFIEEPELFLHPGYQRIFLDTILHNETIRRKNLKIFFTTQSNHLLDISLNFNTDISIFTFRKSILNNSEIFYIETVKNDDLKILNLLGVSNSSVFMSNSTIWVEGITDRKYLRLFLSAYMKSDEFIQNNEISYEEDLHFAFFEYAGTNIEHYLFGEKSGLDNIDLLQNKIQAKYLSNRIFLLADNDTGKEEKHKQRAGKLGLQFQYEKTNGKEIENLLSEKNLEDVMPDLVSDLNNDDFSKINFSIEEYESIGLGDYLKEKLKLISDAKISAENGSLATYYKGRLPDVLGKYLLWDNMSQGAKELTKKIYTFIKTHNYNSPT